VSALGPNQTDTGGTRALSADEIAAKAGMTPFEVNSLSWLSNWNSVPLGKIRPFMEACGIVIANPAVARVQAAYIRRGAPLKYLTKSPEWEGIFKPMILAYVGNRNA
jgi:hypothetical protein